MLKKVLRLLYVSRPISWPNTAFPFAAAYLWFAGEIDIFWVVATFFFLIPFNILMYGINDVYDYESDMKNPRKNSLEGALEQREFHPFIIRGAIISSVPFVIYLLIVGTWLQNLILLGLLFFVVAYSAPKLRFKERPILDSFTSSLHFVGPMLYALSFFSVGAPTYLLALAFLCWGMASHAVGAVQDIIPDRKAHIHSVATYIGARLTIWLSLALYIASTCITWAITQNIAITAMGLTYVLNIIQFVGVTDKTSDKVNEAWKRFIYLNFITGAIITIQIIIAMNMP